MFKTPPNLSPEQWETLYWTLFDMSHDMDDENGEEGAFDASPLGPIFNAIRDARDA